MAGPFLCPVSPISTGRDGSLDHSLHEPGIELRAAQARVFEREQVVAGRDAGAAVADDLVGPTRPSVAQIVEGAP